MNILKKIDAKKTGIFAAGVLFGTAGGPMSRLWTQKVELFSPYLIARRDVSYAARASSSTCCGVL